VEIVNTIDKKASGTKSHSFCFPFNVTDARERFNPDGGISSPSLAAGSSNQIIIRFSNGVMYQDRIMAFTFSTEACLIERAAWMTSGGENSGKSLEERPDTTPVLMSYSHE
jgi:hypothetical protein